MQILRISLKIKTALDCQETTSTFMHKLTNSIFKASGKTVIVAHHGYTLRNNLALAPAVSEEPLMAVYISLMAAGPVVEQGHSCDM